GLVFPAGPLRAPLTAQFDCAQAMLTVGDGPAVAAMESAAALRGLALFRGTLVPDEASVAALKGSRGLAFAGIGDPEKFFATLSRAGVEVAIRRGFPDHHRFTAADAESLLAEADRAGVSLVTTEKDFVRFAHRRALAALAERSRVLPVTLKIDEEDRFRRFVLPHLGATRNNQQPNDNHGRGTSARGLWSEMKTGFPPAPSAEQAFSGSCSSQSCPARDGGGAAPPRGWRKAPAARRSNI